MEKIKLSAAQKKLLLLLKDNVHEGFNKYFEDDEIKQLVFELKQIGFIEVIYNAQDKPTYINLSISGQAYFIYNAKLKNPPPKLTKNAKWIIGIIIIPLLIWILTYIFNKQ